MVLAPINGSYFYGLINYCLFEISFDIRKYYVFLGKVVKEIPVKEKKFTTPVFVQVNRTEEIQV